MPRSFHAWLVNDHPLTVIPAPEPESINAYGVIPAPEPESINAYGVIPASEPESSNAHGVIQASEPESINAYGVIPASEPESIVVHNTFYKHTIHLDGSRLGGRDDNFRRYVMDPGSGAGMTVLRGIWRTRDDESTHHMKSAC